MAVFAVSCHKDAVCHEEDIPDSTDGALVEITFRVSGPEAGFESRSSVTADENKIMDINIFAYSGGALEAAVYAGALDSPAMKLTSGKTYTFYVLANTGRITAPATDDEMSGYRYTMTGISDFSSKGFPMAATVTKKITGAEQEIEIRLERLIAKVELKINSSSLPGFRVNSVRLMNSPKDIVPFTTGSGAASTMTGDTATASDIAGLNAGKSATFYMLENCQGILLPGNKDQWEKVPENIPAEKEKLCTYMEVTADLDGSSGVEGPVTYRFYLGQDETTDFNIFRNTENIITLTTTEDGLDKVSWRIDNSNLSYISVPVIAVGAGGKIFYTDSNNKLTQVTLGSDNWNCITYGNGKYIAVGDNGAIGSSANGINWKKVTAGTYDWNYVTYGDGKFIAVGSNGAIARSTTGITWALQESGQIQWNGVTFGNGRFVAVGKKDNRYGSLGYSSDGVTWKTASSTMYTSIQNAITYNDGLFVAVGKRGTYTGTAGYSSDGINWSYNTKAGGAEHPVVGYGNGKFLTAGLNEILYSEDGKSWTFAEKYVINFNYRSIAFGDGIFVLAGALRSGESRIYFSSDIKHWIMAPADVIEKAEISSICIMH